MKNKLLAIILCTTVLTACQSTENSSNEKANTEKSSQSQESAETSKDNQETSNEDLKEDKSSESAEKIEFTPGEYIASAEGVDGDVEVIVTLSEDKIDSVKIGAENETSGIAEQVYNKLPQAIVDNQSLGVDNVSGATITSAAVKTAAGKAIEEGSSKDVVDLLKSKEVAKEVADEEFDYDVVVAGGGMSGLVSAYKAAAKGANVALVEKNGILGGTSITASGNMLAAPTEEDKESMKRGWLDRSYSQELNPIDMEMLDALIDVAPELIDVYDEIGVDYRTEVSDKNGSITVKINPNEKSKQNAQSIPIPSKDANAKGAPHLIETFVKKIEDMGVDIYLNTPATELINDNGTIKGLISDSENGKKTFNAGAVILATGDYARNKEMDEKYNKRGAGEYSASAVGNTGDGHKLALEAGAVMNPFQESMSGVFNANPHDYPMVGDPTNGYPFEAVLLNMEGKRVFKEDGGSHPQKFEFVREDGRNTAWAIMDSEIAEKLPRLEEYLERTENNDPIIRVYKADTLDELAELTELDSDTLKSELERYNELARAGEDSDFGKDPKFLQEFKKEGPYYAALMYDATRGVYGGIKTSPRAEVVDENDQAIPGLYASGVISSGQFFGDFYPGRQAIGVAGYMGYIAGYNASDFAKENK